MFILCEIHCYLCPPKSWHNNSFIGSVDHIANCSTHGFSDLPTALYYEWSMNIASLTWKHVRELFFRKERDVTGNVFSVSKDRNELLPLLRNRQKKDFKKSRLRLYLGIWPVYVFLRCWLKPLQLLGTLYVHSCNYMIPALIFGCKPS